MDLNYAFVNLIGSSYALDVYPLTRTNEMRIRIRPSLDLYPITRTKAMRIRIRPFLHIFIPDNV